MKGGCPVSQVVRRWSVGGSCQFSIFIILIFVCSRVTVDAGFVIDVMFE